MKRLDCRVYSLTALHGLYMHGLNLESHVPQFELMCSPAGAERPAPASSYQVTRSKRKRQGRLSSFVASLGRAAGF